MDRLCALLFTLTVLLPAGCARLPTQQVRGEDSSLQDWLDAELAPYLAQQLGQHPRFKGESVLVVRLDGPDIQPDIDGLTRSLRDQIMDTLLIDAGVRFVWQPKRPPAQHHRRLDQVHCGRVRDANYYIGIEISRAATDNYRVSVRALDVRASEWVSGFGKSWSGPLIPSELRAMRERRSDESLRGLRVLPFSSAHPDLAATYLANNLSCLLRQQDVDDLVIYVQSLDSDQSGLRTLLSLIGNNLSRYREVRVTDVRSEANFLLRGEAYEIQSGLYQIWVVLHPKNSGEHLVGMDTATYVRVQAPKGRVGTSPASPPTREKPLITGMELVQRPNEVGNDGVCADRQGGDAEGEGCSLLELSVEGADRVFIFVHGTKDGISRLSAGRCVGGSRSVVDRVSKRRYRFPVERFSEADWTTVYAVAVSGTGLAQEFSGLMQVLPDACGPDAGIWADKERREQWLGDLDRLLAANSERAVWTARRMP